MGVLSTICFEIVVCLTHHIEFNLFLLSFQYGVGNFSKDISFHYNSSADSFAKNNKSC